MFVYALDNTIVADIIPVNIPPLQNFLVFIAERN